MDSLKILRRLLRTQSQTKSKQLTPRPTGRGSERTTALQLPGGMRTGKFGADSSRKLGKGCRVMYAGFSSLSGMQVEDGHVPLLWPPVWVWG